MRTVGIVRNIDSVGRIVMPKYYRQLVQLYEKDQVEIYLLNDGIGIRKFCDDCVFCNNTSNLIRFENHMICIRCLTEIVALSQEI